MYLLLSIAFSLRNLTNEFVDCLIVKLKESLVLHMAPHLQSVRLPDTSSETAPLRSTELTGHDDGCFGRVNKDLTNGFHMHSTNGIESKFTAGVKNDGPKRPNTDQPIAVIGMALRFPQDATSPEKFWEMLVDGRSARTEVPKGRYNVDSHYRSDASLPDAVKIPMRNEPNLRYFRKLIIIRVS